MKKITIMAALLGSFYLTSAQVGIGTPAPANSSQLDIVANNKGVLIPRVSLTSTAVFAPISGTEVESLLVYNTATTGDVTPGFYYWFNNKWERIVNQTQLDDAIGSITDLQGDVSKIIALLKVAFPSNNLVDPTVTGDTHGGGMVFTPGTTPTIEYVYFDGTDYVKKDITADIIDIIKGAETKTKIVTIDNIPYYVSESYTGTSDPTLGTEPGVYKIDVIGGIVNNFNAFINSTVTGGGTNYSTVEEYIEYISQNVTKDGETKIVMDTTVTPNQASFKQWNATTKNWDPVATTAFSAIVKANETVTTMTANTDGTYTYKNEAGADVIVNIPTSVIQNLDTIIKATTTFAGSTSTTLVQYIQEMIDDSDLPAGTVTATIDGTGNVIFSISNGNGTSTAIPATAFGSIVKTNETKTTISKSINNSTYTQVTVNPAAVDKIVYEYLAENATNYMDLTSDVEWSIENNTDVQNAIEEIVNNLLSQGGNVYFTRTDIAAGTPAGQLAIPAFSFYTIDATTGVKELVDIAQTIVNAITNANATQITSIKNALGDKIINNSSIITGDTYNSKAVRKGLFTTTITANTATTSGITLDEAASEIISITVKYGSGLTASVTDLEIDATGNDVSFNIGTGNMYQVLGTSDIDAEVIIEFVEL